MDKSVVCTIVKFILLSPFAWDQDCCGPGDGGGTSIFAARGAGYEELAARGVDVFAGKNRNASRRNNMYDR
jgi:hypothetical protein